MRFVFFILLISSLRPAIAQSKFFIGTNDDYSILLDKDVIVKTSEPEPGRHIDHYIKKNQNSNEFMVSIKRMLLNVGPELIYSDDFKNMFIAECKCEVLSYEHKTFNNFIAAVFVFRVKNGEEIYNVYSANMVSQGISYNVNLLTTESNFPQQLPNFENILNHLMFR